MLEVEVNCTEANVSNVQSVGSYGIELAIKQPTPNGSCTQTNQIIEIDDGSENETTHIKSEMPVNASNVQDSIANNDTGGPSNNVPQTVNKMTNVSSVQEPLVAVNENGSKRPIKCANQLNSVSDKSVDSTQIKEEEDVVPMVVAEVDPQLIAPKRGVADVGFKRKSDLASCDCNII